MRLFIEPRPHLPLLLEDLQLVVGFREDRAPEIYQEEGVPKPDRHLLLGLVQSVLMAIEEEDQESVVFSETGSISLEMNDTETEIEADLLMARTLGGRFGSVVFGPPPYGRRLARNAVRFFTGTVRLDIP